MVNPFKEVNWRPDMAERRKFALSLVIGFPCVAVLMFLAIRLARGGWNPVPPLWVAGVGAGVGLVLWLLPGVARPFYVVWYGFACSVGLVVGNLLLMGFFYGVMTPIGFCLRASGRDPVKKSFDRSVSTYWVEAERVTDPRRYYRQF